VSWPPTTGRILLLVMTCCLPATAETLGRTGTLWAPALEWSLENPSWSGNPFDLEAAVTFTHAASGEERTTYMFHDGRKIWRFRFTATRTGVWTFRTSSGDADLDGRSGTVTIRPNPDPKISGFIVAHGNKYARQTTEAGPLEAFVPNIYMNMVKFGAAEHCGWTPVTPTFSDREVFEAYLDEAEAHGCNGVFARMGNQWFQAQTPSWRDHSSENPDLTTFRSIEQAIMQAHHRGMLLHIWAWGDEDRRWTPVGVLGGINGQADRRIQRYMAARLGPLPGWTMSYGSDLCEWVHPEQVVAWAEYLGAHSGWDLLLSARRTRDFLSPVTLAISSNDDRPRQDFYQQARRRLEEEPRRPVLFERRFTYLRDRVWDMDATRRAFWQFTMAGGAGAIWGHYPAEGGCSVHFQGDYPHPEQLRTHRQFWQKRFRLDMEPADDLSHGGMLVLRSGKRHVVFYRENADSVHLDLSWMDGPQPVVAVDTTRKHAELHLGTFEPAAHVWQFAYRSDWAVAAGSFDGRPRRAAD
jgi:hypothetical protein